MKSTINPIVSSLVFILALLILPHLSMGQTTNTQSVWKFNQHGKSGPGISLDGNTISKFSSLICVKSNWEKRYFWMKMHSFLTQKTPTSFTIKSDPKKPSDFILNELKFEAINPTTARIIADGILKNNTDGLIQYIPMAIPAAFMQNATVVNEQGTQITIGKDTIDYPQKSKRLTITSPFGTLVLSSQQGANLTLSDRRAKPYHRQEVFLVFASFGHRLTQGERFRHDLTINITSKLKRYDIPTLSPLTPSGGQIVRLTPVKIKSQTFTPGVFPKPKQLTLTKRSITFPKVFGLTVDQSWDQQQYIKLFNELNSATQLQYTANAQSPPLITIKKIAPVDSLQYDYYEITIASTGVAISSPTPQGVYYAISTLVQMLGDKGKLPIGNIKDWADFPYRGIHLLADDTSLKLHSLFIKNVLGPLKINRIILECEYVKWPSHPEIHTKWGMPIKDVKALLKVADEHFIQVTPLLQTYGHCNYLFVNKSNLDIAENPARPYAYNVSNPRTYQVISDLLNDIQKVFPPTGLLHIGHDEISIFTQYPSHPQNINKPIGELLWTDLQFYQTYAQKNNLSLMLWQDYLNGRSKPEHREELLAVAKKLDKSAVITVWDYDGKKTKFPEIDQFQSLGFRVIAATGEEDLTNIVNFSRYAKKRGIMGMLHTTWTGYNGNALALYQYNKKLWPYVQAGVSFWNTQSPLVKHNASSNLTRMYSQVIAGMYPRKYFPSPDTVTPLNLSAVANVSLAEPGGFTGGKITTRNGMVFELPLSQKAAAAVKVDSAHPLIIPIGQKVKAISILFASLDNATNIQKIGNITITGQHGFTQPLALKREIGNILTKLLTPGSRETGQFLTKDATQEVYAVAQPVFSKAGRYVLWQYDLAVDNSMVQSIKISAINKKSLVIAAISMVQ